MRTPSGLGIVLALALGIALVSCSSEPPPSMDGLVGVWRTDAVSHRDRFLEVKTDAVLFGRGQFKGFSYFPLIDAVRLSGGEGEGREQWRLRYREDDGSISELNLTFEDGKKPRIRIGNREGWWTRGSRDVEGLSKETPNA